ncbi:retrovirus-related Pol polyprotein from transposon RE1 [Trichonephila clavipes]|uniref:Retrovirus-related Pol polyprotein from transposon RE1 n=1 Tax=Trichonephila clavipes TaxID=2585209 RepID=A0A8X6SYL9_TRICX|nr:retrovirus-related Pol polyprotein from transposon RE1 [Trichonephila clavipes]
MEDIKRSLRTSHKSKNNPAFRSFFGTKYQPGEDVGIFISRVKTAATRLQEAGHKLDDLYIGVQLIRWLPQEFQSTVQQIYRWKEEDFRVVTIEAELILETSRLQLMKQDLEKAENAYLSSFTLKKSKTLPGATAAAHGDPKGKNDYQKKGELDKQLETSCILFEEENSDKGVWVIDAAATSHFCHDKSLFLDLKPITNMKMSLATEDKSCPVEGIGTLRFRNRTERFLSKKVIAVRTDGGLEFCNKDMDNFLTDLGIKHEVTNSYTPEMNGVAERFNLTALDGIKTLLKSSEVPHKFWGEALLCFTYAWYRDKDSNKTPFEKYSVSKTSTETPSTSEKPDVSSENHSLIPCTEVKWIRNIGRKVTGSNVYYSIEGEATRLKSFNEIERYYLSEQQEALMVEVTIPNCYKQAIRSRDASKWHDAMDKEINVMMERKVWDLVDHPDNIKILENRWVLYH